MDIREAAKSEARTLGEYIQAKLGHSLASFSRSEGIPVSTLNDRWRSSEGKIRVMDTVFRAYVKRFDQL